MGNETGLRERRESSSSSSNGACRWSSRAKTFSLSLFPFQLLFARASFYFCSPRRHELLDDSSATRQESSAKKRSKKTKREWNRLRPFEFCSPTATTRERIGREEFFFQFGFLAPRLLAPLPPTGHAAGTRERKRNPLVLLSLTWTILVSFCSLALSSSSALPLSPRIAIRRSSSTAVVPRQTRMGIAILSRG